MKKKSYRGKGELPNPCFYFIEQRHHAGYRQPLLLQLHSDSININEATFTNPGSNIIFPSIQVEYTKEKLQLICACNHQSNKLCDHQAPLLYNIMERPDLRIFFDETLQHSTIKAVAQNYGLQNEPNPCEHIELTRANQVVSITPRIKTLQPVNEAVLR